MNYNELKQLIVEAVKDTLLNEGLLDTEEPPVGEISMGKNYRWKEVAMKAVQDALYASADTIDSQEQFENEVDAELQKIREDMDLTISMIGRTLYQVPFQVFKTPKKQ